MSCSAFKYVSLTAATTLAFSSVCFFFYNVKSVIPASLGSQARHVAPIVLGSSVLPTYARIYSAPGLTVCRTPTPHPYNVQTFVMPVAKGQRTLWLRKIQVLPVVGMVDVRLPVRKISWHG